MKSIILLAICDVSELPLQPPPHPLTAHWHSFDQQKRRLVKRLVERQGGKSDTLRDILAVRVSNLALRASIFEYRSFRPGEGCCSLTMTSSGSQPSSGTAQL